ncbi:class I SAM-dependent methyltransferase [Alsobacter sp. R-9]
MSASPEPSSNVSPVDETRLNAFVGRILDDLGGATSAALALVGDHLGLFKALAEGACGSQQLALRTGTSERMVREWLAAMGASGYLHYDPATLQYGLSPEAAMVFADESSPVFMGGFFECIADMYVSEPRVEAAFRSGRGMGWHEHHECLFRGTERFFRTSYNHHLIDEWLPALDGAVERLDKGALIADVGCGHGASTILMARRFPRSRFFGFDYHAASVEAARRAAEKAGVSDRVTFKVAAAKDYPGRGYDLVTFFDCLHDMGDPAGAARHVHQTLAPDGSWMIVEPMAGDAVEQNFNPVGRVYYAASTMICTPASMAQEGAVALGAQAGPAKLGAVIRDGGFRDVRIAASTPFNLVLEARP